MRAAAPAQFPVASQGIWHLLLALLMSVTLATLIGWLGWHVQWRWAPVAVLLPASVALALWFWFRWMRRQGDQPGRRLVWDGAAWHLDGSGREPGQPELIMDGGAWMLLRWHALPAPPGQGAPRSTRWLPFSAAEEPINWHAFRVAVVTAAKGPSRNAVAGTSA